MSKKESYWFSHDSDAANNPSMVALIDKYGFEGYGRWWRLLERLRACEGYRYHTGTPFAWAVLGKDLQMNATEAEAFVHDCINYFGILQTDGQYLWSDNLLDRMEYWEKRREVLRERGKKGGEAKSRKQKEDNEAQAADDVAQAENRLAQTGKVMNILSTIEANDTKQNQTKLNETTFIIVDEQHRPEDTEEEEEIKSDVMENKEVHTGDNRVQQQLDILRDRALADDQRFVYAYVSTGRISKPQLAAWLTAFNTWLLFAGEQVKEERDYRRHFASWFRYRDVQKEDPAQYNPAAGSHTQAAPLTITRTVPLPVAKSLLKENEVQHLPQEEEQPAAKKRSSFQLKTEHDTRGKYSGGENKYDMYWLKNLWDEVKSMGG